MSREWMMYLNDMVESAELAMSFAAGLGAESFEPGQMAYDAILRRLEIIGEAAGHIPQEVRSRAQDIMWRDIIGLRNRLAHGYFAVERDILWNLVSVELPITLAQLKALQETLRLENPRG